ncbi:L-asparagine oxygenase [Catenulispora sp. GP43]|uniref:TauD/TfdA family dioxygenase n=1 Tax=Catenulispora sp. GP43 TaxID=3156263 RepID=UPI003514D53D
MDHAWSAEAGDITLTAAERATVAGLGAELVGREYPRIDEQAWVTRAREHSAGLPDRLRAAIRAYRHDPGVDGLLLVRNLPIEGAGLPPTPMVAESVERIPTGPAAVIALLASSLGELAAYRAEKGGALVQNVVPVPGREGSQSNAGSVSLEMHVENAFHPHRPDYVGLLCLRNDHEGQAGTVVSSIRRALEHLPAAAREVLHGERFVTAPPPSFSAGDGGAPHAVLTGAHEDPDVRVDFNATVAADDEAKVALEALREAFTQVSAQLPLAAGELAFVDNRISVHGRTAFTPRYDGRDRWLHRAFVHLDGRRTRGHRPEGAAVLV